MPRVIQVRTGTRLHFGPLASGATEGRCFGGIGIMIALPAISFRAVTHDEERYVGCSPATMERIRSLRSIWESAGTRVHAGQGGAATPPARKIPPLSWEFKTAPVEHAGFGTGTQLSLAVASVLSRFEGTTNLSPNELAHRCQRGRRSAIGLHGFVDGGFIVDAGKTGQGALGDLAVRLPIPEAWRVIVLRPRNASPGLSGARERAAFEVLPPMPAALTDRLCRLTLMEILPAIQSTDCFAFSAAISEYGRLIGDYFSTVQGGIFAEPHVREVAHAHPELGHRLVQSSWGPSVVTFAPTESAATDFCQAWQSATSPTEWQLEISPPLNHGVMIHETAAV